MSKIYSSISTLSIFKYYGKEIFTLVPRTRQRALQKINGSTSFEHSFIPVVSNVVFVMVMIPIFVRIPVVNRIAWK